MLLILRYTYAIPAVERVRIEQISLSRRASSPRLCNTRIAPDVGAQREESGSSAVEEPKGDNMLDLLLQLVQVGFEGIRDVLGILGTGSVEVGGSVGGAGV